MEEEKIKYEELMSDLAIILKDELLAKIEQTTEGLIITFENNQSFKLSIQEL